MPGADIAPTDPYDKVDPRFGTPGHAPTVFGPKGTPNQFGMRQWAQILQANGWPRINVTIHDGRRVASGAVMLAIMQGESGGKTNAVGDGGKSFGAYQIHLPSHPGVTKQCAIDPVCATKAALRISGNGRNFEPWSVYKNKSYLKFLEDAELAWANPKQPSPYAGYGAQAKPEEPGLIGKYVLPALKVAAGGVFLLAALAGVLAVAALAKSSKEAVKGVGFDGSLFSSVAERGERRALPPPERGTITETDDEGNETTRPMSLRESFGAKREARAAEREDRRGRKSYKGKLRNDLKGERREGAPARERSDSPWTS